MSATQSFRPTRQQRLLLDYIRQNNVFKTVAETCKDAGVDRSSYYKWCKDPAFRRWFTAEWSTVMLMDGWHQLAFARGQVPYSVQYFKLLFNLNFTTQGQAAFAGWQALSEPAAAPAPVGEVPLQTKPVTGQNSTFRPVPPAPAPPRPNHTARQLQSTLDALRRLAPPSIAHASAPPSGPAPGRSAP